MKTYWMSFCGFLALIVLVGCTDVAVEQDVNTEDQVSTEVAHEHPTVEVTADNIEALINGDTPVLLDFWATWCGPCVALTPTLEELAIEYDGQLIVGKVNVDEQQEIALKYDVSSIPALFYVRNGEVVAKQVGNQPKANLVAQIEEVLAD